MLQKLFENHALANIVFLLVITMGIIAYSTLPRQQDPSINFNWLNITTILPGASSLDVEQRVTEPLEDAIRRVSDVKFVSSSSRDQVSSILVRFEDLSDRLFDKRLADLRSELDRASNNLPDDATDPQLLEITTANAFPSATVVVSAAADGTHLRAEAERIKRDLERLKGVSEVRTLGLADLELRIAFRPDRLEAYRLTPGQLADTLRAYYRNQSAGSLDLGNRAWSVQLRGLENDIQALQNLPVQGLREEVLLRDIADITFSPAETSAAARFRGRPAVLLQVTKKSDQNVLELVERIGELVDFETAQQDQTGVQVVIADDQTEVTRNALKVMQNNAMLGLGLVMLVTWLFLGWQIAFFTSIAIPFSLAGVFWLLSGIGQTLNVSTLLGIVISLGMLVDDAVVVVESIYHRLQQGMHTLAAALSGLREVFAPITSAVLTTIAAFLPLMLLPGILGKFMLVIPLVVTSALAISLIEAYWLLPAHIIAAKVRISDDSRIQRWRTKWQWQLRHGYCRALLLALRRPWLCLGMVIGLFIGSVFVVASGTLRVDFFASDPLRIFYVNVQMPPGVALNQTIDKVLEVEGRLAAGLREGDARSVISYAGQTVTETEFLSGTQYGQIQVSLAPKTEELRSVDELLDDLRPTLTNTPGVSEVSFLRVAGGPPVTRDISVKVRGDDFDEILAAVGALEDFMRREPGFRNISDDDLPGQYALNLRLDSQAVMRSGLTAQSVNDTLRYLVDGQVVGESRFRGEKVEVRLLPANWPGQLNELLQFTLPAGNGAPVALGSLLTREQARNRETIRHYNFRRAVTLFADIDLEVLDIVTANDKLREHWQSIRAAHPGISLDFSGVLDDIEESLTSIQTLFLFGIGLMYLILSTQFRSYFQPLLVLSTVPMAFIGVIAGLLLFGYPLSLYTLYGGVALAGIAVNSAIVLISAINTRREAGQSLIHAVFYAARRRVIPILITSLTTIAGLSSLAIGLGGSSLLWGPVATCLVFGLACSTVLTLFSVPTLYLLAHRRKAVGG